MIDDITVIQVRFNEYLYLNNESVFITSIILLYLFC